MFEVIQWHSLLIITQIFKDSSGNAKTLIRHPPTPSPLLICLIFMSLYFISINNRFNEILQINYVAVAAFWSKAGKTPLIRHNMSFCTCSASFTVIYFLPDPGMAFSTLLRGKAHFHTPVVLWRRWLDSPFLPVLTLKAGGVGGGSSVFPAPEKDDEPWEYCPIPSFGKVQMEACLRLWSWFEVVWVQFITGSSFLTKIWEAARSSGSSICSHTEVWRFSVWKCLIFDAPEESELPLQVLCLSICNSASWRREVLLFLMPGHAQTTTG